MRSQPTLLARRVGVHEDYEGASRPIGSGFNIDFDERHRVLSDVYLQLVLR